MERPMVLIDSNIEFVDNSAGDVPLDFSRLITTDYLVPNSLWLETGRITCKTRLRFEMADFGNTSRGERFNNPTSSQWGYAALMADNYTQQQFRLQFENQEMTIEHPVVDIFNCRNSVPITMAKDVTSGTSHFFSVSPVDMCIKVEGVTAPPPAPTILTGQGTVGDGGICLKGLPGREAYTGTEVWPPGTDHKIFLSRRDLGWFDEIRGVCYPRTSITIKIDVVWDTVSNDAPLPPINQIINSDAPFPIYTYGCALGVPIPSLTNPPCSPASQVVFYDPVTGAYTSSCPVVTVP